MVGRSWIRPVIQIQELDTFEDNRTTGAAMVGAGAGNMEEVLNNIHTMLRSNSGAANWYDPATRSNETLNTDLQALEQKPIPCRTRVLTSITVPASANFKVLSVSGSEAPTRPAAVGLATEGAIVAQSALNGAGFAAHELIEVAGADAIGPQNLLEVRSASTGQRLQSSGRDIFGLLQYESTGADGAAFDDVSGGARVKISFVRMTAGLNDLEACPVADIENQAISYQYFDRRQLSTIPAACLFGNGAFLDHAASADVTLDNAIDNQAGAATQGQNIDVDMAAGVDWEWRDAASQRLFAIIEGSGGGASEVQLGADVDTFNVDAVDNDFANGASFGTSGTPVQVAENAGVIERAANLIMRASGAGELFFDDSNQPVSWAQTDGVKLSETAADWSTWETNFGGEVSIMEAINATYSAAQSGGTRTKVQATLTSNVSADSDINGPGTPHNNVDVDLAPYDLVNFVNDVEVFLNGELMPNAAALGTPGTVYPGGDPNAGDIRIAGFDLKGTGSKPDQITMIVNGQ